MDRVQKSIKTFDTTIILMEDLVMNMKRYTVNITNDIRFVDNCRPHTRGFSRELG